MISKSLPRRLTRAGYRSIALGGGALLVAGCQFGGLNSLNMPGTAGHGSGSYKITVQLPDVSVLPQNSPVMVDDVTVGSVSGIDAVQRSDGTFYAAVEVSLDGNVTLPQNATAKVAQTSLLGSQHLELAEPEGEPGVGRLRDGSQIPLDRTGRYPTTEEVLSSLGVVVNKGNLGALQDITDEAYAAVAGRRPTSREFRRRCRSTRRRITSSRPTAGPHRRHRPPRPRRRRPRCPRRRRRATRSTAYRCPRLRCRPRPRWPVRRWRRATTSGPVCSPIPRAELACTPPALTNWRLRKTGQT
ncbi:hypothetical protein NIIDNTM18_46270 [Mycolicibacterium litorale]|uniref:Mce/MlaD domain-containing protein n=1 Tax=Mycolicibacterium litorale TaxID=758802 RepID=A0A6S6PAG9_9MYCO|nr:hypothetical protein NIIDNTM18_46270 [Mycolicibacterium litorale]